MLDPVALVGQLGKGRLLVLGDVMLDEYIWGEASRISPEAPVPVVRFEQKSKVLGGAANAAATAAVLGGHVSLCGVVGDDEAADSMPQILAQYRINNLLVRDSSRPTTTKIRVTAARQQVVRIDTEEVRSLTKETEELMSEMILDEVDTHTAVLISDYAKGVTTEKLMTLTIRAASERGVPVVVDPKGFRYAKYRGCTVVTPNTAEAEAAIRHLQSAPEDFNLIGTRILQLVECAGALITQGAQGMTLFRPGAEPLPIPTAARNVFDVTGAGDTVAATLALGLGAGVDLEDAARLANIAASVVVSKVGTSVVEPDELLEATEGQL
jgi:rfaE bifunctional protein kinase chain/domain